MNKILLQGAGENIYFWLLQLFILAVINIKKQTKIKKNKKVMR